MCSAPAKTVRGFFVFSFRCILFVLLGSFSFAWTNTGGGDHGGASWAPANGATIGGNHTNIGTFTVGLGTTVYVTSGTPLKVYAHTITVSGTINGDYAGYEGGTGGSSGGGFRAYSYGGSGGVEGGGSGSGGSWGDCWRSCGAMYGAGGGGGGGYGGRGAPGGSSGGGRGGGDGGPLRGNAYSRTIEMGSGAGGGGGGGSCWNSGAGGGSYGGAGGCCSGGCTREGSCAGGPGGGNGGRGGGAVLLNASTVTISGTITLNGGGAAGGGCGNSASSSCEAGRGGGAGSGASGGGALAMGDSITFTGTIRAIGGPGGGRTGYVCDSARYREPGNAGGQGGGGRVKLFATSALSATGSVDVSGYESGTYKSCLGVCIEANSSCAGGYMYDGVCDNSAPAGTILVNNGAAYATASSVSLFMSCSDDVSGCSKASFSNDGVSYSTEEDYAASRVWSLSYGDGTKTVYAKLRDLAGNSVVVSDTILLDTTYPQLFSVGASLPSFSPDGNGVKDAVSILFSTDEEMDGAPYNATILVRQSGLPSVARTLIKDNVVNAGAHLEVWDGTGDNGLVMADGSYTYDITLVDRVGNRNSSSGNIRIDLTPPEFVQHGSGNSLVELGDLVAFSSTLLDVSGIDSVFVCNSSSNCMDGANMLCKMTNTTQYIDKFSCTFTPSEVKTYSYYIFANDTQNLFSNASGNLRVRKTGLSAPHVSLPVVDLQSKVRISVDYLENDTYPIENADCVLSGGAGGSLSGITNPYYIEVYPPKPERIDFVVSCSKEGYTSRSASGYFTGRDLDVDLSYEDVPLAANYTNYVYAIVSTVNDYSLVRESADVGNFSISGEESFSGNMTWNGSIGRWVANFTPTKYGTYSARVDFKKDGIDGSRILSLHSDKSLNVSFDAAPSVSVDLGSSAVLKLYVTNKGPKGRVYNVSFIGDLYPVAFDGVPLSGRRDSETVFVPADTTQEHIILVKGMEVSPFERSFLLRVANVEKPNIFEVREIRYKVVSNREDRRFAPDIDAATLLVLALFSLLFVSNRKKLFFLEP